MVLLTMVKSFRSSAMEIGHNRIFEGHSQVCGWLFLRNKKDVGQSSQHLYATLLLLTAHP